MGSECLTLLFSTRGPSRKLRVPPLAFGKGKTTSSESAPIMTTTSPIQSSASISPSAVTRLARSLNASETKLLTFPLHHLIDEKEESLLGEEGLISRKRRLIDVRDGTIQAMNPARGGHNPAIVML